MIFPQRGVLLAMMLDRSPEEAPSLAEGRRFIPDNYGDRGRSCAIHCCT
jgi:hypothetical protein